MNAQQMLHERTKKGLLQLLNDGRKRTKAQRAALEAKYAEVIEYERKHPEVLP